MDNTRSERDLFPVSVGVGTEILKRETTLVVNGNNHGNNGVVYWKVLLPWTKGLFSLN